MLCAMFFVLTGAGGSQALQGTPLNQAYEEVVAARKVFQAAEAAREQGIEPLPGEYLGTVGGGIRLGPHYSARQERLQQELDRARDRLEQALAQWNSLH
jgi:hypothetical protein